MLIHCKVQGCGCGGTDRLTLPFTVLNLHLDCTLRLSMCQKGLEPKRTRILLVYEKILYIDQFLEGWVILS